MTSSVVTRRPNASVIGSISSRIEGNPRLIPYRGCFELALPADQEKKAFQGRLAARKSAAQEHPPSRSCASHIAANGGIAALITEPAKFPVSSHERRPLADHLALVLLKQRLKPLSAGEAVAANVRNGTR
jgi:hypothetical protein